MFTELIAQMKNLFDLQSLLYLVLYVVLIGVQWIWGFHWIAFLVLLFVAIGVQVVHHNHIHLGIWSSKRLNHLTNLYISVISAVPSAMMFGGHIKNHHVHQHGPEDVTRTYRFGGDHNHLLGYFLHPFQAFFVLIPMFWRDFLEGLPKRSRFSKNLALQVGLISVSWIVLAAIDWQKFMLLVLAPQAFGLHWLLGANYFQHAHCDDESDVNYARNFTGPINWVWMNIGFHTAHHDHPKAHWATLRTVHREKCQHIDPRLCCGSFFGYVLRAFFLSIVFDSCRSHSLKESHSLKGNSQRYDDR